MTNRDYVNVPGEQSLAITDLTQEPRVPVAKKQKQRQTQKGAARVWRTRHAPALEQVMGAQRPQSYSLT